MLKKIYFPMILIICTITSQMQAQTNFEHNYKTIKPVIKKPFYFITGMNFNKQNISLNDYASRFNYDLNDYQKNLYQPAYLFGIRWETKNINNHKFAFTALLNKIATGNNYKDINKLSPFINNYSKFLAEDHFLMLSISAYYKQLIPISDTNKYRIYFTIGPSINTRLSNQSNDNLINNNYNKYYVSGDGGLEYNNQSYYTLFVHYKYALNSFTKNPLDSYLNSIELGAMITLKDIF
jgi:hypothetical protein